ncbi:MAG TPA: pantetheine-phosphate adenylyltransferase [Methylomusa anaerophila]|uniref:Phosphopantetheine adenylyltransferase n=1 Tax=Methylomusa anaerophila TaxID=1930071 RepID=A0A348AQ94_9FIRM|nr:pantetheine-phosphate adenylyltransferase [Methylomusa anaerophila]BBB93242.1 phosphopantetheine adenylyltransferase [Methylomusa anaerophila]HML86926.1 pantetheine-phosphate adenylyltransferase [Methylomusa anaerophila]
MRIAVCPGSFDPVTNGHLDIFFRASKMVELLIVAVFHNPNKKPLFSMQERVEMLTIATQDIPNIKVDYFSGLLSDYVKKQNSNVIVRGLRALSDFEYEFQRALLIKKIDPMIETIFMMTSNEFSFVSSSGIKELAKFGGPIDGLVPTCLKERIIQRIHES